MMSLPESAVNNPETALVGDADGATGDALLGIGQRDRRLPLAIAIPAQHHLIAPLRRVVLLEVGRLFLELRRLDAALVLEQVVRDIGNPQRAIGTVGGC